MIDLPFDNSYARLPERFFARVLPTPVAAPRLIRVNEALARELGLDPEILATEEGVQILAGNTIAGGSEPIATAYAGHQFGHFVPQLGDGRAILLGEVVDAHGVRRDVQLKGPGRTPYSRGGDGRAAVGPVLREYVVSEAMHALGIPTTRALAAVSTGEGVQRETTLPGAVLTRVAASHIRVGTFQFFASRGDVDGVRTLADHVIARHYPAAVGAEVPYRALLDAVIARQAALVAQWQLVGFIHGVMNTDNTSVAGETIDYGPCAFMDEYDPATVYSSIDRFGRYAYGQQPAVAVWNLARLAECLLPVLGDGDEEALRQANEALEAFAPAFEEAYEDGLRRKIGLVTPQEQDALLAGDLLRLMAESRADWTLTFRRLSEEASSGAERGDARQHFGDPGAFDAWAARWRARLAQEPGDAAATAAAMLRVNPAYVPRNHQVEAVIRAATDSGDLAPFEELLAVLARPYESRAEHARFALPPEAHERVLHTFCGT